MAVFFWQSLSRANGSSVAVFQPHSHTLTPQKSGCDSPDIFPKTGTTETWLEFVQKPKTWISLVLKEKRR